MCVLSCGDIDDDDTDDTDDGGGGGGGSTGCHVTFVCCYDIVMLMMLLLLLLIMMMMAITIVAAPHHRVRRVRTLQREAPIRPESSSEAADVLLRLGAVRHGAGALVRCRFPFMPAVHYR